MRRARHLFDRIAAFPHLARAFVGARRRKRPSAELLEFTHDLEPRLWAMRRALLAGPYPWGEYRQFWIRDPKPRLIRAAPFADRVLHHAIVDVLDPILRRGFIADSYACLPDRGVHRAVARFVQFARERRGAGYVLQCDIKSYFASVDHHVLNALLARRVADRRLLELLRSLIEHGAEAPGIGMPIGNLTSQMFANLYLDQLDHFVREDLRVRHYLRYMDDFILLVGSRDEAWARLADVETFVRERLCLRLNPRRVVVAPLASPRDVLGTCIGVMVGSASAGAAFGACGDASRCSNGNGTRTRSSGHPCVRRSRAGWVSRAMPMRSRCRAPSSRSATCGTSANGCSCTISPRTDESKRGTRTVAGWRVRSYSLVMKCPYPESSLIPLVSLV